MSVIWSPAGTKLNSEELDTLAHPHSSGIILFDYNYKNPVQIKQLINQAKQVNNEIIVSVDQEGGRVQRFVKGMTSLPSAADINRAYNQEQSLGYELAYNMGRLNGEELRGLGVNLNYAPVLDLDRGINDVLVDRSFGSNFQTASTLADAWIEGLQVSGITGVGKHFPGHGGTINDSHLLLPKDTRDEKEIRQDLRMFSHASSQLNALMTSHVIFPAMDKYPASFSKFWLDDILRNEIKYKGIIISDDLTMKAVQEIYPRIEEATEKALYAGCDLTLICNDVKSAQKAIKHLDKINASPVPKDKIIQLLNIHKKPIHKEYKNNHNFKINKARIQAMQYRK